MQRIQENFRLLTRETIQGLVWMFEVEWQNFNNSEISISKLDKENHDVHNISFIVNLDGLAIWIDDFKYKINNIDLEDYSKTLNIEDFRRELELDLYRQLQKHFEIVSESYCYLSNYEADLEDSLLDGENKRYIYSTLHLPKKAPVSLADYGKLELTIDSEDYPQSGEPQTHFATISFGYATWSDDLPEKTQRLLRKLHFEFWRILK